MTRGAMESHAFDLVIVGSGAGGGTMARALASTGRRILLIERGRERALASRRTGARPRSGRNCATGRPSTGSTRRARSSGPYTHYNVGGNTKFWGSVLYRLRREDFGEIAASRRRVAGVADHVRRLWRPGTTSAPNALYHVHGDAGADPTEPPRGPFPHPPVPHGRTMRRDRRRACAPGPAPVAAAARPASIPGEPTAASLCNTCNSFPCRLHARATPTCACVRPAVGART